MQALTLSSFEEGGPKLTTKAIPTAGPGSMIVKPLTVSTLAYANEVYVSRKRAYPMQLPLTIGSSAIARVHEVGPDTTLFEKGDLVLVDVFIRGRDDPGTSFLFGLIQGFAEGGKKLMGGEWRDATYAEYAKVPLENTYPLNEAKLTKTLGLPISSLNYISRLLVPMGGLCDLDVKAGETVLVCPSTGNFGAGAVEVALAMGANVIAAGRTASSLQKLSEALEKRAPGRLTTATISGNNVEEDTAALVEAAGRRPIDAFIDLSPPEAAKTTHIRAAIMAIKPAGRVSLMGGIQSGIEIPYATVMHKSLKISGRFMYERDHVQRLIGMAECGILPLDDVEMKEIELEKWEEAFNLAAEYDGLGRGVVIKP